MDPRIRLILRVIEEKEGIGEMASKQAGELLGISEAHFLRLFREGVKTTFRHYLLGSKMRRAAELVKDQSLSIKSIASASGYNDVSNFYRDFKRVYGMSPGQIRDQYLILRLEEDQVARNPTSPSKSDSRGAF